jgi:dolichol-phosphate mannosyltransferase
MSVTTLTSFAAPDRALTNSPIDVAVVLPTYNEGKNIPEVIARVRSVLEGLSWEMIFVDDDSPDGTAEAILEYAKQDRRIRLVQRVGRRGLSSACIEGMLATSANYIAVMDADQQHDETILPKMLARLREEELDIVVGTRNADGGSMGQFSAKRVLLSRLGRRISKSVCHCELSDPMSGFFLLRRGFLMDVVRRLQGEGFKILVDLLASAERRVRVGEIGYRFRLRKYGESKLDLLTAVEYLFLIVNKLTGGVVPTRFAVFALIGATGVVVHLACLAAMLYGLHFGFVASQTVATCVAMTENFFLNNLITYRDQRLRGMSMVSGLVSFWLACSFGAWANVSFAHSLLNLGLPWYGAGLGGVVLSSVWNYSVSNLFTWKRLQPRREGGAREEIEIFSREVEPLP